MGRRLTHKIPSWTAVAIIFVPAERGRPPASK